VRRRIIYGLAAAFVTIVQVGAMATPAVAQRSDAQIRRELVRQSIANYPGSCPCPYSTDRAGRRCGGRSAYSRPGGYAPLCYPSDIRAADPSARRRR
jgi:hypothetical protein